MEKITLVLLGATGFVGRELVRQLCSQPERYEVIAQVRNLDALPSAPNLTQWQGDLHQLHPALFPQRPHVLVHFAVKNIDGDGSGYWHDNVEGTRNLLAHCNGFTRGVIYGSTLSVHGQGAQSGIAPTAPCRPQTPLAKSRAAAEALVLDTARQRNISAYCLRPRFILGKGDRFVLPGLIRLVEQGLFVGNGRQRFSLIDVADYARLIADLGERMLRSGEPEQMALNVGYRDPLSFAGLYEVLQKNLAPQTASARRKHIPFPAVLARLLKRWPSASAFARATQLELIGVDHYGDVSLTRQRIQGDYLNQPVLDRFARIVAAAAAQSSKEQS